VHELTSPKKGRPKKTQTTVTDTKTQSNACSKGKERFQKNSTMNEENESSSKRSKVSTFFFSLLICFYFNSFIFTLNCFVALFLNKLSADFRTSEFKVKCFE
jgi:hypothetical protein